MKKICLLIAVIALSYTLNANVYTIYVTCIGLNPSTTNASCGDSIKWTWGGCSDSIRTISVPTGDTTWSFPINSVTPVYRVVSMTGTYAYTCYANSKYYSGTIKVTCTTGLNEISTQPGITLYPNPAKNDFTIQAESSETQSVQIFDISGKLLLTQIIKTGQSTVNTANLDQGIYNVCITTCDSGNKTNRRLVILK